MQRQLSTLLLASCLLPVCPVASYAQGILVITNEHVRLPRPIPRPEPRPITYHIENLTIEGRIRQQVAEVQVSQTFKNSGSGTIQAQFVFPLPYDGAIDAMTLLVDGKEFPAKLLKADEARDRYRSIVRAQQDPALLEWIGTGMFQTSVFPIPAGETRTVSIQYTQLLRKERTLTEFLFPLSTAKYTARPISQVRISLHLDSEESLKNLYSPTHLVAIQRPTPKQAKIVYEQQNTVPRSDFRLFYDAEPGTVSAQLLSYRPQTEAKEDGYFLLLATPELAEKEQPSQPKTVIFAIDKSGSMAGAKMEQTKEAAKYIINNLKEGDLFNIVVYNSAVDIFRPELESYDKTTREEALAYVDGLFAGGGTNIHDALTTSLKLAAGTQRPTYVLFMTDGRPTSGVTAETAIAAAAKAANQDRSRIIAFGVGYDVNSRLLDRLARENYGLSSYVRPDENIEEQIASVYRRISSPVLTNAELSITIEGQLPGDVVNRVYPAGELDLFAGEQLVVVGRYRQMGNCEIKLTGKLGDETKTFTFTGEFEERAASTSRSFVEKLWALRRIGEIIDELDLSGKNQELIDELVMLSTKHGILTPYTAFLADETVRPELLSHSNRLRTRESLSELEQAEGRFGFEQRGLKQDYKNASNLGLDNSRLLLDRYSEDANRPAGPAATARGGANRQLSIPRGISPADPAAAANVPQAAIKPGPKIADDLIRQVGGQTLYKRGELLVTPETAGVDLEQNQASVVELTRYSDAYFQLIDQNSIAENELLAAQQETEQLLVKLRGQVYLIK